MDRIGVNRVDYRYDTYHRVRNTGYYELFPSLLFSFLSLSGARDRYLSDSILVSPDFPID
jgi:hypothetical protein